MFQDYYEIFRWIALFFFILFVIGLIRPKIGGFWTVFIKNKTRVKLFPLNMVLSILFSILASQVTPSSEKGRLRLENGHYQDAISYFSRMAPRDKNYLQKEALIQKARDAERNFLKEKEIAVQKAKAEKAKAEAEKAEKERNRQLVAAEEKRPMEREAFLPQIDNGSCK